MTCFIKENTLPKYVKEFLKEQNIQIPTYGFQYTPKHLAFDNKAKIFVPSLDSWIIWDEVKQNKSEKPFGKFEEKDFELALQKQNIGKKVRITFEYEYTSIKIKKAELKKGKSSETITGELVAVSETSYTVKYFDKQRKEDLSQSILKSMITDITYL